MFRIGVTLVAVLVGTGAGWWLRLRVAGRRHRYDDEAGLPARRTWWLLCVAPILAGVLAWNLSARSLPLIATTIVSGWILLWLAAIDADVHRLPNAITLPSYPILAALLAVCAWTDGDGSSYVRAIAASLVTGSFFLALAFISPGGRGLGMGDVKLSGLVGMLTGYFGWATVLGAVYGGIVIGGVWALGLLVTRRAGRGSRFAFGPFLASGAVLALLLS